MFRSASFDGVPRCRASRVHGVSGASLLLLALALLLVSPGLAGQAAQESARPAGTTAWEFAKVGLNGVLYPSLMLNIAKMKVEMQHNDNELGDQNGLFGVAVTAPKAGAKAVVEIVSSSPLVNSGRAEATLARKGKTYTIYPFLTFPDQITLVRQPVTAKDVGRAVVALVDGTFARTTGAQIPVDGGNDRVL